MLTIIDVDRFRGTMILIILLLAGCAGYGSPPQNVAHQMYIDANLHFSISYPQSWSQHLSKTGVDPYPDYSVAWDVPGGKSSGRISFLVVSIPDNDFMMAIDAIGILREIFPNLSLTGEERGKLPAGPARIIDGATPHETLRAWSFDSPDRTYLLIFGVSPEAFAGRTKLFQTIAESFEPL